MENNKIQIKPAAWSSSIKNSNEKRVLELLKEYIPKYFRIEWNEENFKKIFCEILNILPPRYKQKNSIELQGKLKLEILREKIEQVLDRHSAVKK